MTTEEILAGLKTNRAEQIRLRDAAAMEVQKLDAGIAALSGADKALRPVGPSVAEMVLGCFQEFTRRHKTKPEMAVVITRENVLEQAALLFPSGLGKIKTGSYNAFTTLAAKNKIKRAPGGWELVS